MVIVVDIVMFPLFRFSVADMTSPVIGCDHSVVDVFRKSIGF